jgi:hypothetical protein
VNLTVECLCPGAAHPDGDTITLRERLDFQGATGVRQVLFLVAQDDPSATDAQYAAALAEHYLLYGIESWTLVDADRKPIPVTKRAIREYVLSRPVEVRELSDEAQSRFYPQVLATHVDRQLDISADGLPAEAPEAVLAVLDYHYPDGRHRDDYVVARWRLQYLAELNVGSLIRQHARREDDKVIELKRATGGR